MRRQIALLAALAAASVVSVKHLALGADEPMPLAARIVSFRLDNGLRVVLCPRPGAAMVSCVTCVKAGIADEGPGQAGLAGLLARLAYDARPRGMEESYAERLARLGAVGPCVAAGPDATVHLVSIPAAQLESWAALEAERLQKPCVSSFEQARQAALREWRGEGEAQPFGWLYRHFLAAALEARGDPTARLTPTEDLPRCSPADAQRFHQVHYTPERIVVAVAGGLEPEVARAALTRRLGNVLSLALETLPATPGAAALPRRRAGEQQSSGAGEEDLRAAHLRSPVPLFTCSEGGTSEATSTTRGRERRVETEFPSAPILLVGFTVPARSHPDAAALEVLAALAGEGRGSRLGARLLAPGLARSVSARLGPGAARRRFLLVTVEAAEERSLAAMEGFLDRELARLRDEPPTQDELCRAAALCRARWLRGVESDAGLAAQLAEHEALDGGWEKLFAQCDALSQVTPALARDAARQYLTSERRTTAALRAPPTNGADPLVSFPTAVSEGAR